MPTMVPPVQFTLTGLVLPTEADILAGVQADINSAFGGGVNPALETPQGQLASSETAIIGDVNDTFAQYVNQVDPANAAGRMQDAIGRIYFIERKPASPTSVQCLCIGRVGTIIPANALAVDTAGNLYGAVEAATIPIGGAITIGFAAIVPGPTSCPANTLTGIYQAIPGWDTVNNPLDGIPGAFVESRTDFEARRQQSVALNGRGSLPAIYGEVFQVKDVIDVYVFENTTSSPISVGTTSFSLVPHSLYVAAVGGDPQEICDAIWLKKDVGCDYNGNTTRTVTDKSGYDPPYPAYAVTYQIPTPLPIFISVSLGNDPSLPSNIITLVTNALLQAFVGNDGGTRARIGSTIYASRFYAPLVALSPFVGIVTLFVGAAASPTLTKYTPGINQAPTLDAANIVVALV